MPSSRPVGILSGDEISGNDSSSGEIADDLQTSSSADSLLTSSVAARLDEELSGSHEVTESNEQPVGLTASLDNVHTSNSTSGMVISHRNGDRDASSTEGLGISVGGISLVSAVISDTSPLTSGPTPSTDSLYTPGEVGNLDQPTSGITDNLLTEPTSLEVTSDNLLESPKMSLSELSSGTVLFKTKDTSNSTFISGNTSSELSTVETLKDLIVTSPVYDDKFVSTAGEKSSLTVRQSSQDQEPGSYGDTTHSMTGTSTLKNITTSSNELKTPEEFVTPASKQVPEYESPVSRVSQANVTLSRTSITDDIKASVRDKTVSSVVSSQFPIRESDKTASQNTEEFLSYFHAESTESNALHRSMNYVSPSFSDTTDIRHTSTSVSTVDSFANPDSIFSTRNFIVFGSISSVVFALVLVNCLLILLTAYRENQRKKRRCRRISRNLSAVNFRQINTQSEERAAATRVSTEEADEEERTEDSVDLLLSSPDVQSPSTFTSSATLPGTPIRSAIRSGRSGGGAGGTFPRKNVRFEPGTAEATANHRSTTGNTDNCGHHQGNSRQNGDVERLRDATFDPELGTGGGSSKRQTFSCAGPHQEPSSFPSDDDDDLSNPNDVFLSCHL